MYKFKSTIVLFLFLIQFSVFSQINSDFISNVSDKVASQQGEFYSISLLTAAPGDNLLELYFWWGHCAIIVEDLRTGNKKSYDYGIFSMDEDKILLNFLGGRIDYIVASRPGFYFKHIINSFLREDRWVVLQRLNLEPASVYRVVQYLQNNVKPENKTYKYHFYKENCSTKVRDIIDYAVGGQLFDQTAVDIDLTYRDYSQQYLAESFIADWGLMYLLSGKGVDQQISRWDSFFLPYELMNNLQNFKYRDSSGVLKNIVIDRVEKLPPGKKAQLGSGGLINGDSSRIRTKKPITWLLALFFGLITGTIGALLFLFGTKNRAIRIIGGIYTATLILLLFVISLILFYMSFFSSHDVTYNNVNLILVNPFTMLFGFLVSVFYAANVGKAQKIYTLFWILMAVVGLSELVMKLFGLYVQDNLMILSALLPLFVMMSLSGIFRNRIGLKK